MGIQERLNILLRDLLEPVLGQVIFCGLSKFQRVVYNLGVLVYSKQITDKSIVLERNEDMFGLITDRCDVPHWFLEEEKAHLGRRRNPSDPMEYGPWQRCIGKGPRLEFRDVYNPGSELWLKYGGDGEGSKESANVAPKMLESIEESADESEEEDKRW